ncbi:MAG: 6-phosphofructokinase [Faecalibacterium sp.]|jgi:6-phosphofructokinase 1|nr:6-phosphofructokinase [Faecalibacterium sp.]
MAGEKILIGQSGGPTAAINASLAGICEEAKRIGAAEIFGMRYGIEGFLQGKVCSLGQALEAQGALALLCRTPSSFLGSCRCKLPDPAEDETVCAKVLSALETRGLSAFFYIGGNDSMDTIEKLSRYGSAKGSPVRFIGVPKTIDNDLCLTDHTPGYGSAAKFIAVSLSEILCDATVYDIPSVTVVEIMGRNAGWLTGAASLSALSGGPGPDLVLLPEAAFDEEAFLARLTALLRQKPGLVVAISEGIRGADGTLLCEKGAPGAATDAFGHRAILSGAGEYLAGRIRARLGCKARAVDLSILQRCASHLASAADLTEAQRAGAAAMQAAAAGETGCMVAFRRADAEAYACETVTVPVGQVANREKKVPREWITADGMQVTDAFVHYAAPLIQGEAAPVWQNGVPCHLHL